MNYCLGCESPIGSADDLCDACLDDIEATNRECKFCCCPLDNHAINCPENDSSFAQLMQKGYD